MGDYASHIREINESRCTISITWDDVPHLDEKAKEEMRRATPPHMASAREYGIPAIGSGRIYPVNPKDIRVKPFEIPDFWPRLYALDVGIRRTAALWMAWDREDDVVYLTSEHYRADAFPSTHAAAIHARGTLKTGRTWIPGLIDPTARNRSPFDGNNLIAEYTALGLILAPAKNAVESGIYKVNDMFAQDRIRVFSTLEHFFEELRWYRRDENGKIVKREDHLCDCLRYLIHGYEVHAITKPHTSDRRQTYRPGIPSVGY